MSLRALELTLFPHLIDPPKRIIGLDLGQASDFTAVLVATPSRDPEPVYQVPIIERIPLETRYPQIVSYVAELVAKLRLPKDGMRASVTLVVDYTGVGRPVLDMILDRNLDCDVIPVTITAGASVHQTEFGLNVPKRELASVIQRLLQERRLVINHKAPMAATLTEELKGFKAKISASGHISYAAAEDWRSAKHDDLVLGLALALWYGEWTKEN